MMLNAILEAPARRGQIISDRPPAFARQVPFWHANGNCPQANVIDQLLTHFDQRPAGASSTEWLIAV